MKFQRIGSWAEVSDDGAYTVSAHRVNGQFGFQAWRRPKSKGMAELLGTFPEASEARAACERDANPHEAAA